MASRGDARSDTTAGTVLGSAWSLRWRAPELALLLAERTGAMVEWDRDDWPRRLQAEATAVLAAGRLGLRLDMVDRAIEAVRLAESHADGTTAAMLRIELAGSARSARVPLVGAAVLRPVLTEGDVRPSVRADALVELARCLALVADGAALDATLAEADRLYTENGDLDADGRVVRRALLRSVISGEQRRRGDARAAVRAAREGADLLAGLARPSADNGQASARVALRLVHGLLDLGRVDDARAIAAAELARPVRAPAAGAIGWLALAMAVRWHLAIGAPGPALALLGNAAELAQRHDLTALRAEALSKQSDAHERLGQLIDALDCLRLAQGVRLRRARSIYSARTAMIDAFGEASEPDKLQELLSTPRVPASQNHIRAVPSAVGGPSDQSAAEPDLATETVLVLVDLSGDDPVGDHVIRQVQERMRDVAPAPTQIARVGGAELGVLLPAGAPIGQAALWIDELRGAMARVDWTSVTPGLTVTLRPTIAQRPTIATRPTMATRPAPETHTTAETDLATPTGFAFESRPDTATFAATSESSTAIPLAESPNTPLTPTSVVPSPLASQPAAPTETSSSSDSLEPVTVPLPPQGVARAERVDRSGTEASQDLLAKALEQWRQNRADRTTTDPESRRSHRAPDSDEDGPRPDSKAPTAPEAETATADSEFPIPQSWQPATAAGPDESEPTARLFPTDEPSEQTYRSDGAIPDPPATPVGGESFAANGSDSEECFSDEPTPPSGTHAPFVNSGETECPALPSARRPLPELFLPQLPPVAAPAPSPTADPRPVRPRSALPELVLPQLPSQMAAELPELETAPSAKPRHSVDAVDGGRSVLSGLAIAEGSGGRRRAREEPEQPAGQVSDIDTGTGIEPDPEPVSSADWHPPGQAWPPEPALLPAFPSLPTLPPRRSPGRAPEPVDAPAPAQPVDPTVATQSAPEPPPSAPSQVDLPPPEGPPRLAAAQFPATEPLPVPTLVDVPSPAAPVFPAAVEFPALEPHPTPEPHPAGGPPEPVGPRAVPDPPKPAAASESTRPPIRNGSKRRQSVKLADLLTEALMAYQTVRDSEQAGNDSLDQDPSSSLPGPTSLPGPLVQPVGLDPAVGAESPYPAPPTRPRNDSHRGESRWLATRWDPADRP